MLGSMSGPGQVSVTQAWPLPWRVSSQEGRQMGLPAWRWGQHAGYQAWLLLGMLT